MSPARAGIATPQRETIDTTDELKTTQPATEGTNVPRRRYASRYRKPVEYIGTQWVIIIPPCIYAIACFVHNDVDVCVS